MKPNVTLISPGTITVPRGRVLLPQRLVIGNDLETPVAWGDWDTDTGQALGMAGAFRLDVSVCVENGAQVRLELLNTSTEPLELRELAWQLLVEQPDRIDLLPECGISTAQPWEFNLTHDTLTDSGRGSRHLCLSYGDEQWFIGSNDPMLYADGHLRAEPDSPAGDILRLAWHRVEPKWSYNGMVATRPLNGLWIHEGQTRLATIGITVDAAALTAVSSVPAVRVEPVPLCIPAGDRAYDRGPILEAIERMHISRGEYSGLFAGGYDFRNKRQAEPHVCRAEYGEFLLHEFMRTGDSRLWDWVAAFAERFAHVSINRSSDPEHFGAVRGRYGDNDNAHPIRSMRGAAFFWDMAEITGNESYRRTAIGIADFLTRMFPWTNARQGAAVRDLVYMYQVTGEECYLDTSREILALLERIQQPEGGWFEYWNDDGEAYVYDQPTHHGGEWTHASPMKPEMQTYNLNGLLDTLRLAPDLFPELKAMLLPVAEWLLSAQSAEGPWPFPGRESRGLFGYALMLDASAMLKAGRFFKDERFTESGRRGIAWGLSQIEQRGYVPGLVGIPDADQIESSMTSFYALEAMAAAEHEA
jgi:hypothetical protein